MLLLLLMLLRLLLLLLLMPVLLLLLLSLGRCVRTPPHGQAGLRLFRPRERALA